MGGDIGQAFVELFFADAELPAEFAFAGAETAVHRAFSGDQEKILFLANLLTSFNQ